MTDLKRLCLCCVLLLAACDNFQPPPTATPTRELTGPTLQATAVFRGEVPTEAPQFLGQNDPTAAAVASGGNLPPVPVGALEGGRQPMQLVLASGRTVMGDLYAGADIRVPGVLMLAPDSTAWLDLPLRLQAAGLTALTINTADITTVEDFSVILESFSEVGSVDPGQIAVVGAESGADVALAACATALLCDAVALISPVQRDPLLVAMQRFNPRSVFLAAGQDDAGSLDAARAIEDFAQGEAVLETGLGAARGTGLIQANPTIGDRLIDWLQAQFDA